MHTPVVLLSLGLAVAVATGSLADHADVITGRNLAAARAERAAAAFVEGCSSLGCDSGDVNATRLDGTILSGCVRQAGGESLLQVRARVPWNPRVFTGLTPATGMVVLDLGGFNVPAATVLRPC